MGKGVHKTLEELQTLRDEGDALALKSGDLVTEIEEIEATFQKPSSMMELLEHQRKTAPLHERLEILDDEMRVGFTMVPHSNSPRTLEAGALALIIGNKALRSLNP